MTAYKQVIFLNCQQTKLFASFDEYNRKGHHDMLIYKGCNHFCLEGEIENLQKALANPIKTLVICMYREPISRHISAFFEDMPTYLPMLLQGINMNTGRYRTRSQQYSCVHGAMEKFLQRREYWELYHPLSFDWSRKPNVVSTMKENADLLWLRYDQQNLWQSLLQEWFPGIQLIRSSDMIISRDVRELYEYFLQKTTMYPSLCLLFQLDKTWFEHFYSPAERSEIKKKYQYKTKK